MTRLDRDGARQLPGRTCDGASAVARPLSHAPFAVQNISSRGRPGPVTGAAHGECVNPCELLTNVGWAARAVHPLTPGTNRS
jgi:hypothetical protein